jgi:adenylate cyclase
MTARVERRLAAILAADVAGYSRLIGVDEEGTLARLKSLRAEIIDPQIGEHHGRLVKTTGDGLLVEFASVVDALRCAAEMQKALAESNAALPPERRIEFRIGVNMGDIVVEDGDIFGDGVNVAVRLEGLAEPGGICVAARVQEDTAGRLGLTFEDMGEQQLKNIARPVRAYRVRPKGLLSDPPPPVGEGSALGGRVGAAEPPALSLPDKPSIAVLPFANISGDPEQEYFAEGMVEEIITALSRIRWLFVIARNSTFTYKGQAVDVKRVGHELGVRYVLEGSVRRADNRVRIAVQPIDAFSGTHLWADRFDGSLEDVFELQDNVATSVAGIIEPTLQAAEICRSRERPTSDLRAYDLYLRALTHTYAWKRESALASLGLLNQAIDRDPSYGPALAVAAFCHCQLDLNGWTDDRETNRHKAVDFAQRAVRFAAADSRVLANAALVLGYFGEDIIAAIGMIDRSLALNPSYAQGWHLSGWLRLWAGQTGLAIEHFETSARLNPRADARKLTGIGQAHFFNRHFDDALENLVMARHAIPMHAMPYRFLASCYAHMGRLDEAREVLRHLRAITPVVLPTYLAYRNPEHRQLFLSGLRLADGEPE